MHTTRDTLYLVEFRQARLRRAKHRWIWPRYDALDRLATTPSRDKERKRKKTGQRSDKGRRGGEGGGEEEEEREEEEEEEEAVVEERREKRRARG